MTNVVVLLFRVGLRHNSIRQIRGPATDSV